MNRLLRLASIMTFISISLFAEESNSTIETNSTVTNLEQNSTVLKVDKSKNI